MKRNTIKKIQNLKNKRPITCLTAYSSSIAKILDKHVDIILIGDSVGTTIYGMKNTRSVTLNMMINHGLSVTKSSKKALTVIDMPFKTYENKKQALQNAKEILKKTKCQAIKVEIDNSKIPIVSHLVKNKINVVSHIGVLPQRYNNFFKIKKIRNNNYQIKKMLNLALKLQKVGSCMILLECVHRDLSKRITDILDIPTIGIGSSSNCDGQVLVINDILNIDNKAQTPKFVKKYTNLSSIIEKAVNNFTLDVKNKRYPR
tara:strand:- start:90 stop:866 length:777 start_codon:yes stop_codon:yes gene_type:complete